MGDFPAIAPVRQRFPDEEISDIAAHVRNQLHTSGLAARLRPGMQVAVGVGSRGISSIRAVVTALVQELQALETRPFLVPAMGSHGGGTAAGQQQVLESYGLGEAELGVPVRSDMTATEIGRTPQGMPVYFDVHAGQADAVVVVNRIKPHTSFRSRWESGLCKMLAVGLGKEQGAATYHGWGIADAIPAAVRVILAGVPVLGGIGIVENGYHRPARIVCLPAECLLDEEPKLLDQAWRHLPRIPLEPLDLLVLQEIGKDISGTGMDLNVVGMWRRNGGPVQPEIRVLAALDLTPNSHGNAIGVGYADLIPQRLRDKIDTGPLYTNCLTSANFNGAKIPITLPTDRDVIQAGLPLTEPQAARLIIARNTLDLAHFWVSAALLADVEENPELSVEGPLQPLRFDDAGALLLA